MKTIIFIFLLGLVACTSKRSEFSNVEDFQSFLNDPENGYISKVESQDLLFETKMIPALKDDSVKLFSLQLRISRLDGQAVLDFGGISKQEVLLREGYLSFDLLNDVYVETDGEIINPTFHHYERNFGLKPSIDILFHFPNIEPKNNPILKYRDALFGQGLITIELNKQLFTKCHVKDA